MKQCWPHIVYELPTAKERLKTQYHYSVLDVRKCKGERTIARFKSKLHAKWFADVADENVKRRSEAARKSQ